jgi:hypothetical protein
VIASVATTSADIQRPAKNTLILRAPVLLAPFASLARFSRPSNEIVLFLTTSTVISAFREASDNANYACIQEDPGEDPLHSSLCSRRRVSFLKRVSSTLIVFNHSRRVAFVCSFLIDMADISRRVHDQLRIRFRGDKQSLSLSCSLAGKFWQRRAVHPC